MTLEPTSPPAYDDAPNTTTAGDNDNNIAPHSRIAHHHFTSSALALGAELRALLRRGEAVRPGAAAAVMSVSILFPQRVRRLLWSWVASAGGGGNNATRAKIVERARHYWGMSLSLEEFEVLGGKIGGGGVGTGTQQRGGRVETRLVVDGGGVWEMYRAYYAVLGRLARGEYEESRQGWNVMVRDVRVVLRIIGAATGEGGGGVGGGDWGGGGGKWLDEKEVVAEKVVEVKA